MFITYKTKYINYHTQKENLKHSLMKMANDDLDINPVLLLKIMINGFMLIKIKKVKSYFQLIFLYFTPFV